MLKGIFIAPPTFLVLAFFLLIAACNQKETPEPPYNPKPLPSPKDSIIVQDTTVVIDTTIFVRLTEFAVDSSAGDLEAYLIETTWGTYYLEKLGLGLSSMIDSAGNDWISFEPTPGSASAGEFRGFPNAVFNQDDSFFHPKNTNTGPSTSEIILNTDKKVSIKGISGNENWECLWDFYPTHCTFTMTKVSDGYAYWALYEGTPGGTFDTTDWWMTSAIDIKQLVTTNHDGDIPDPEWIVFGDDESSYTIFLINHADDDKVDNYFQMGKEMTVFGFGREDLNSYLNDAPRSISIGFYDTDDHIKISNYLSKIDSISAL